MTRYTNMGQRKRKLNETGFNDLFDKPDEVPEKEKEIPDQVVDRDVDGDKEPARKKRKRSKKKKDQDGAPENEGGVEEPTAASTSTYTSISKTKPKEKKEKFKKSKGVVERALASEQRRQKRIQERHSNTTCFACRQNGHAAKDCPSARSALDDEEDDESRLSAGKSVVSVCYRCGSTKHTLSRCRQPAVPGNPFPHASCFVCSGKGHLASSCPKNAGKGIYPNGGSCKLCGDVTHLARDCTVGKDAPTSEPILLGKEQANNTGADEDDFHTVKRKRLELEKAEGKLKKQSAAMAKSNAPATVPKKVVKF